MRLELKKANRTYWRDAALAGVIGGVVMLGFVAAGTGWLGQGFWLPFSVIASALPSLPPPVPGFDAFTMLIGGILHLLAAAGWAMVDAALLAALSSQRPYHLARSWIVAVLMGLGFGIAVDLLMGLLIGPALAPGVRLLAPTVFFAGHIVFGIVTAVAFTALVRRPKTAITFAPTQTVDPGARSGWMDERLKGKTGTPAQR